MNRMPIKTTAQTIVHVLRLQDRLRYCRDWFGHFIGGLYRRADEHHVFLLAGGLSFSVFTCVLPMVLIIFAVLGHILKEPSIAAEIDLYIDRLIPYERYADRVKDLVFVRVDEFIIYKSLAGILGVAGLFFAASGLFSSMRTALNAAFRSTSTGSLLIGKLRDLGLVLLVIIYFLLSTTILPGLDVSRGLAEKSGLLQRLNLGFVTEFALQIGSLIIIFISFFVVYFAIPRPRPSVKTIALSALCATLFWHVAKLLFGYYITSFVTLKQVYGAYFFLIVVAFWIYYTSLVFIISAEIGQLYREWIEKRAGAKNPPAQITG